MFTLVVSGMMIMMPVFRIIEDAVCRAHYATPPGETVDERLCKVDEVKSRLAYLGGWAALVNSVVGLLTALPYGVVADL